MHRKVVKTYDRKKKNKFDSSKIHGQIGTKSKETINNDTLEDPFDTTFDRIYKEFK